MKFSKDYTKLDWDKFTTIRLNNGYYKEGKMVKINTPTKDFKAKVVMTEAITKGDITEELAEMDADCSREELIGMLENWYGKKKDDFVLIWMEKVRR